MKQTNLLWATLTAVVLAPAAWGANADMTDVLHNKLGEGDNLATLTMRWGDNVALDNLAEGVWFNSGDKVAHVIATALREDSRFYALKNSQGEYVAFGFDTNGDNSAAVSVAGAPLDLVDGVAVADGEYADAAGSGQYDHWKINSDENAWKVFVNGAVAGYDTVLAYGDKLTLEYCAADATVPAEAAYTFYLRPADQQGIWMQEEFTFDTANGKRQTVPFIANVCGDLANLYGSCFGMEVYAEDGETSSNAYSCSFTWGNKENLAGTVSVSSPQNAVFRPFLNIRKVWEEGGRTETRRIYGDADSRVEINVANPLTGISLEGIEPGGVIEVDNMGVYILKPVYEPADADFTGYNATFDDEQVATLYKSVNSVVAHSAGETQLTISSADGSISSTYTVRVKDVDPDNKPDDEFQDGVVWLNEEWFGHTSGSLNYVADGGELFCRAYGNQNGNMAFGATSQFGMAYAGKYFIMSKQAWDGGDTRPLKSGGRVVVFDAKTFRHIGAIDEIGGDGRACVGVTPSKVYLGTSAGIRVLNVDDLTVADSDIEGTAPARNGQIGDMVKSGSHVFATNVGTGLIVIDTETDRVVKTIPMSGIQTVALTPDGRVWMGCAKTLTPVDPVTLEAGDTYNVPGSITCSTYSWRHGNLMASVNRNELLWGSGTFYRWNIDEVADPSTLEPVYTHVSKVDDVTYGNAYGSPAYDDRTDTYMFASQPGFGAAALQNWYHFIDATTGEVKHRIHLPEYWWFPAMPIIPDKHDAKIDIDDFTMDIRDGAREFDLAALVTDRDNHDCNINVWLADEPAVLEAEGDTGDAAPAAEIALEGKTLTVTPKAHGKVAFTLMAESNGRTVAKTVNVSVTDPSGISSAVADGDVTWRTFDAKGIEVGNNPEIPGVYFLKGSDGSVRKVVVKRLFNNECEF